MTACFQKAITREEAVKKFDEAVMDFGVGDMTKTATVPGGGIGLVATQDISEGERILSVPQGLMIGPTIIKARHAALGKAIADAGCSDIEDTVLALGLMREARLGEASPYALYLASLPTSDEDLAGMPTLWSAEEREKLLKDTHALLAIDDCLDRIKMHWDVLVGHNVADAITVGTVKPPTIAPTADELFHDFVRAHALVSTRALPFGQELTMIPYLDMANHRKGATNSCGINVMPNDDPKKEEFAAVITTEAPVKAGDEVVIDYCTGSSRASWDMLLQYAFVEGETEEDFREAGGRPLMFEGIKPDDPIALQKRAALAALGCEDDPSQSDDGVGALTWIECRDGESNESMGPLLRLARLNTETAPEMAERIKKWDCPPKELWEALNEPLDDATEADVARQIIGVCDEALSKLPALDDKLRSQATDYSDLKACFAARVIIGERHAVESTQKKWSAVLAEFAP